MFPHVHQAAARLVAARGFMAAKTRLLQGRASERHCNKCFDWLRGTSNVECFMHAKRIRELSGMSDAELSRALAAAEAFHRALDSASEHGLLAAELAALRS